MTSTSVFLLFLLIITGFSTSEMPSSISNSEGPKRPPLPIKAPASRSLLSPKYKPDTAIIASLDGTVYLVESNSGKVYWSFSSGPPLSSSHQALPDPNIDDAYASGLGEQPGTKSDLNDNYFVDIGDDWNLYVHSKHFGRTKLPMTVEEYINSTPHISEDGGVTLGSKKTSVFLVDAKTGKVIHTYGSPHAQSISGLTTNGENLVLSKQDVEELMKSSSGNVNTVEPLFVTRTDYALQSFAPNSEKVLWNMTVSEIGAAFLCQGIADTFSDVSFDKKDKLGLEYQGDFEMPLPCRTKAIVYRTRDNNILQSNLEFSGFDKLPEASPPDSEVLPLPSPYIQNPVVLNMPNENKRPLDKLDNSCETENSCLVTIDDIDRQNETVTFTEYIYGGPVSYIVPVSYISLLFLILVVSWYYLMGRKHSKSDKQLTDSSGKQSVTAKRKKSRRAGNNKNISTINRHDKHISSEIDDVEPFELTGVQRNDRGSLFDLTKAVEDNDGRWVGKLFVSNTEIAMGSNGTIVFEGIYDGRPVAVKRLVQAHNDVAFKEIQNLIASDQHPNIVRWYGVEYDLDFVYLSLERCTCSLNDLIQQYSETYLDPIFVENLASNPMKECTICIGNSKGLNKDIELWKANGYPSSQLLKLMRDVVSGLTHLHELGIIHRDLKPQNVLIIGERYICAKLSDMGISKRLLGDMSSLGHHATGYGSSGWQAPEQLLHGRQTRAMDLFSLGCVLFFCITGGKHPFGDRLERDINIVKNRVDLFLVEQIPEAVDLISHLLDPNPDSRPKALEVLQHPLFWNSEMRLSFLRDTSDRIELEDRENESELLIELEKVAPLALGGKWDEKMEAAFITNIGRYRRYKFDSTRDLLRVIRNKFNHYRELPKEIQEILGPIPEGFSEYFASRFPKLLIEVYKVIYRYCRDEECFWKYFKSHLI